MRRARLRNKLAIVVDHDIIEETNSEKLLGVVVNNNLTWKEHLYCDNENKGLITQLKKMVGTLREAFQSEKQRNLGISPNRVGRSQVSVGKCSKLGGGLRKSKKS